MNLPSVFISGRANINSDWLKVAINISFGLNVKCSCHVILFEVCVCKHIYHDQILWKFHWNLCISYEYCKPNIFRDPINFASSRFITKSSREFSVSSSVWPASVNCGVFSTVPCVPYIGVFGVNGKIVSPAFYRQNPDSNISHTNRAMTVTIYI